MCNNVLGVFSVLKKAGIFSTDEPVREALFRETLMVDLLADLLQGKTPSRWILLSTFAHCLPQNTDYCIQCDVDKWQVYQDQLNCSCGVDVSCNLINILAPVNSYLVVVDSSEAD